MEILYEEENEIRFVTFDATLRFVVTTSASVTEHPVERGAAIADHSKPNSDTITAECFVSSKPIKSPNADGAEGAFSSLELRGAKDRKLTKGAQGQKPQAAEYQTQDLKGQARVLTFSQPFDRLIAVRETLSRICTLGLECLLVTNLGDFSQVLITRVTSPREAAGKVVFTLDFRKVAFVDSEIVPVEPLETRAERERRLGARGTEEAESEEDISLAAQLVERFSDSALLRPARRDGHGGYTR